MKKEIEKLENIIANVHPSYVETIAKKIYNAGYHKTIWHKIKNKDLPETNKLVLCLRTEAYNRRYTVGCLNYKRMWDMYDNSISFEELDAVLAWTELPEYKG